MKKIVLAGFSSLFCSMLLSSCGIEMTHDSTSIKQVKEIKLADGSTARVGSVPILPEWHCRQLYKKSGTLLANKMKASFTFGGAYQELINESIDYANQNHLKTNYIYIYSPSEAAVDGFNLSIFKESSATFYQCKKLPAVRDKLFG